MKSIHSLSLRMKFVLLFTLLIGGISTFIYWYFPAVFEEHALHSIAQKAELMTRMSAFELRSAMVFGDRIAVEEHVRGLGTLEDLLYAVAEPGDGEPVSYAADVAAQYRYRDIAGNTLSGDGEVFQTVAPVVHEGTILGRLYLGVSVRLLREEIAQARRTIAWISVVIFGCGTALVLVISSIVTTSLNKLGQTFDKIADGNYAERAEVSATDEIGLLAAGFNRMAEKVQRAIEKERELHTIKSRFIRTVSHEFRTPLAGIGLTADLLLSYAERMSREEQHTYIAKIRQRVADLNDLIDEFLEQSSASSMSDLFAPTFIDLPDVVQQVVASMAMLASARDVTIITTCDSTLPALYADARFVQHIVRNLLSNAVKYSPSGSTVYCSVEHTGTAAVLRVADHGIGIPAEDLGSLYTPFFRASNSGGTQGTGLGLSIVREFVEMHGGSIEVQSTVGEGSVFTVTLPVSAVEGASTGSIPTAV